MGEMKKLAFEQSPELKRTFNELSERWCRKYRLGIPDLAEKCGVSAQYLSHIGRYGRVPSKPILTLLALNLEAENPDALFRMAGVKDPWPYDRGIGLRPPAATENGLLSINLDMNGFANVIRDIVRAEVQPKRLADLLKGRALKFGLNRAQFFMFEDGGSKEGFFVEMVRSLALTLNCEIEFLEVGHNAFLSELAEGRIDAYGPVYSTAQRHGQALLSKPFCGIPLAVLARQTESAGLNRLPLPRKIEDLGRRAYVFAVHRDSMAHHYARSVLAIPDERLILCEDAEEGIERILLARIPRPAHLLLTDAPFAEKALQGHRNELKRIPERPEVDAPMFQNTIALRPDWQSVPESLDQALDFLRKGGAIQRILERSGGKHSKWIMLY
jgi:ABC-type amino acid transport substrate-binding protein